VSADIGIEPVETSKPTGTIKPNDKRRQIVVEAIMPEPASPGHGKSYRWDTVDKSPEERKFLFKLDAALLTVASLRYVIHVPRPGQHQQRLRLGHERGPRPPREPIEVHAVGLDGRATSLAEVPIICSGRGSGRRAGSPPWRCSGRSSRCVLSQCSSAKPMSSLRVLDRSHREHLLSRHAGCDWVLVTGKTSWPSGRAFSTRAVPSPP
jgi:hypothetical protein